MSRRRWPWFGAFGGLFRLLILAGSVAAASTASVRIGEANDRYHFGPTTAYVNVGGSVTWTNGSDAPHTVTSDAGNELASSTFGSGKTYSHTFNATGTFTYHCTIHSYMVAKVVVLAAGQTPPPTDTGLPARPAAGDSNVGRGVLIVVSFVGGVIALRRVARVR